MDEARRYGAVRRRAGAAGEIPPAARSRPRTSRRGPGGEGTMGARLDSTPWGRLAEIARSPRETPRRRLQAERELLSRLDSLTVGERIALARRATGRVLERLLSDRDARVVRAARGNPRAPASLRSESGPDSGGDGT
ncbi:MAG: hypothetical protein D6718_06620 [Acidobacteria bacterium]|nr:MAG: hypothetical protein D6718_06620 [Acidobacteriota bacterium]